MESIKALIPIVVSSTIVIGGVSISGVAILNAAKTVQQAMNFRQVLESIEFYKLQYGEYPKIEGNTPQERWNNLINFLVDKKLLYPMKYYFVEDYDYKSIDNGAGYYLKAGKNEITVKGE